MTNWMLTILIAVVGAMARIGFLGRARSPCPGGLPQAQIRRFIADMNAHHTKAKFQ